MFTFANAVQAAKDSKKKKPEPQSGGILGDIVSKVEGVIGDAYDQSQEVKAAGGPEDYAAQLVAQKKQRQNRISHVQDLLDSPYPGLDPEQSNVLNTVLGVGAEQHATPEELLAAVETGLVESSLRNLHYGDADSEGFRQERTSQYGTGPTGPTNVKASAGRLFDELKTDPGTQDASTPGLMAQAAQGSAYPERYDEEEDPARALLSEFMQRQKRAQHVGLNVSDPIESSMDPSVKHQLNLIEQGELTKGPGDLVVQPGVDISQGKEAQIAARLKLLSSQVGEPVYDISAYRSPQHSVEVGGFEDDPHTEGQASDIGIGAPTLASAESIPESAYRKVGLYRPFYPESSAEANHVQLIGQQGSTGDPIPGSESPSSGVLASSYSPSSSSPDLMSAALDSGRSQQPPQSGRNNRLAQVMGLLDAPLPSVTDPLQPLKRKQDELLKLALGARA